MALPLHCVSRAMSARPAALAVALALACPAAPAAARTPVAPTTTPTAEGPADAPRLRLASRAQALTLTGATSLGFGALLLATMAGGLVLGRVDRKAADAALAPAEAEQRPPSAQELADQGAHERRARMSDGLARAAGITGGVLVVVGAALLGAGLGLRKRGLRNPPTARRTPRVGPGSLGLRLSF